jgi:transcriptional repressor NrdR
MVCPACNSLTHVLESRGAEGGRAVRRRRECSSCGRRFTTYERPQPEPLFIRKRGGQRQRFDPEKLRSALTRAAHKRDVSREQVDGIVRTVEGAIAEAGGELRSGAVGELCLAELREVDRGAYLQFAGTLPQPSAEFAETGDG